MRLATDNRISALLAVIVLLASVIGLTWCAPPPSRFTPQAVNDFRSDGDFGAGPARPVGSPAPDFVLPLLRSYLKTGDVAKASTVRLSSFRGKMPVVLILTGYT